jgi:hypothetical protein
MTPEQSAAVARIRAEVERSKLLVWATRQDALAILSALEEAQAVRAPEPAEIDFAVFSPWLRTWAKRHFGKWITHNTAKGALAELHAALTPGDKP